MGIVLSLLPSSTTIISQLLLRVFMMLLILEIQRAMFSSSLYAGTIIEIMFFFMFSFSVIARLRTVDIRKSAYFLKFTLICQREGLYRVFAWASSKNSHSSGCHRARFLIVLFEGLGSP